MRGYHVDVYGICLSKKNTAVEIYVWSCQAAWEKKHHKKSWQEYTEELYKKKKKLNGPDNHEGVITHLEPDILEFKVKWALGSITMNKASGGDEISVELFQILKDDAVKVMHSICQQIWKTQQWPQNWKRSVFIPIPKKGNVKEWSNYRTTALISHDLLEKEMATHSNILAWKIPWMEEPGRLQSMGSQTVGHGWATSPHYSPPILASTWSEFPKPMFLVTLYSFVILF